MCLVCLDEAHGIVGWFSKFNWTKEEVLPPNLQHPSGAVYDEFERLLAVRSQRQAERHSKLRARGVRAEDTPAALEFVSAVQNSTAGKRCSLPHYTNIERLAKLLSQADKGLSPWWETKKGEAFKELSFIKHGQWGIFDNGYGQVKTRRTARCDTVIG